MISDGICYLVLTDKSYPKRLAFLFLEDIAKDFVQELQDEYAEELLFLFKITVNNVSVVGNEQLKLLVDNMLSSNLVELLKCICVIFIDPCRPCHSKATTRLFGSKFFVKYEEAQ